MVKNLYVPNGVTLVKTKRHQQMDAEIVVVGNIEKIMTNQIAKIV